MRASVEFSVDEEQNIGDALSRGKEEPMAVEDPISEKHDESFTTTTENVHGEPRRAPLVESFKDHFTLKAPTSVIRYRNRNAAALVIEANDAQFVLEETVNPDEEKNEVSIRRIHDTSEGVRVLRLLHAVVAAFFTGFLFILSLQLVLFLFLDFAIQVKMGSDTVVDFSDVLAGFGVLLAFPGFVFSLSCALVIAGAFVLDTLEGHLLIRSFTFKNMPTFAVEWIFFALFSGIPLFSLGASLLAGSDYWLIVAPLVWFTCVVVSYCIFSVNVVFYEMRACWVVTQNREATNRLSWRDFISESIILRQIQQYSGRETTSFLSRGSIIDSKYTDQGTSRGAEACSRATMIPGSEQKSRTWLSRLTEWRKLNGWGLVEDVRTRMYSIEEARDVRPYVTSYTWSLEKVFCRPTNSRYIAIVDGPGSLTPAQIRSSVICSVLGTALIFFILAALLRYLKVPPGLVLLAVLVVALLFSKKLWGTYKLYKTTNAFSYRSENTDRNQANQSQCIYLTQETFRLTKPTTKCCWILFSLELLFFYFVPMLALLSLRNYGIALLFIVIVGISAARYYINAAVVLEEVGDINLIDGEDDDEHEKWQNRSRLDEILGTITRGRSIWVWQAVLFIVGFVYITLVFSSLVDFDSTRAQMTFAPDLEYKPNDLIPYASCQLSSTLVDVPVQSMLDYAFLAGQSYESNDTAVQSALDVWFGSGGAINEQETVASFPKRETPVIFKLFSFPMENNNTFAVVSIRGTTSPWEALTDAQLWNPAILMQVLRAILPFGEMWSFVLESETLDRISFYNDTSDFVAKVQKANYTRVAVTGHSLGGGLAMITGAQRNVSAIALSGPNSVLSRKSFKPPVSIESLDKYTFNIVPDRDVVPMIDDKARNWQGIRCTAGFSDLIGCHSVPRALCEIMYSCGSGDRPVMCECVHTFKYPEPVPREGSDATFAELCPKP